MGVPVAGCDVQSEVLGVLNDVVSQPDVVHTLLSEGQLLEDWVKNRIKLLPYILQKDRCTELNGVFQGSQIVCIRKLDDSKLIAALHVFHPFVGLT